MPPKSRKRKAPAKSNTATTNGDDALTPPDRNTWPGWVEMESEPAFFNVMLKDMGVHGVKINEVWSLDDDNLAILPQPVHALIFLFRYRETDKDDLVTECPADVWYAEQVPDFACASVALLNIVNNVPGLEMGKELRNFKDFTQDMTPQLRGEAIDDFTFVKRIHNSFAREADILQADMCMKEKAAKARKRQAVAKAQKTKAENAARKAMSNGAADTPKTTRTSGRARKSATKFENDESHSVTPQSNQPPGEESRSSPDNAGMSYADCNSIPFLGTGSSTKTNGLTTPIKKSDTPAISSGTEKQVAHDDESETSDSASNATPTKSKANVGKKLKLNAPKTKAKVDPNADYNATVKPENAQPQPRRSGRQTKPRKDLQPGSQQADEEVDAEEEGFHFCAYMPIRGRVWKLDGMDKFPQDMGALEEGESWLVIAQSALQSRIAQYAASAIEFNLMAVVHDPLVACVGALASNVKALRAVEQKLAGVVEDWREMLDDEKDDALREECPDLGLRTPDVQRAEMTQADVKALDRAEDLTQLLALRQEIILQQCGLRRACRDEMDSAASDAEKAMSRRHDYSKFAKEWLSALAKHEVLGAVLEEES